MAMTDQDLEGALLRHWEPGHRHTLMSAMNMAMRSDDVSRGRVLDALDRLTAMGDLCDCPAMSAIGQEPGWLRRSYDERRRFLADKEIETILESDPSYKNTVYNAESGVIKFTRVSLFYVLSDPRVCSNLRAAVLTRSRA